MKRKNVALMLALGLILCSAGWYYVNADTSSQTQTSEAHDNVDDGASVLVQTCLVRQENLSVAMAVFGDVGSGKVSALSFPQAGQLSRLAVVVGQQLHGGDLIAELSSDPAARVAYTQAATAVEFARRELRRSQDLLHLQLATQAQLDASVKQLQDAQDVLTAQTRLGGATASARLFAPFAGVVTALPQEQGERLAAGATVLRIGRSDVLRIELGIEAEQSHLLHLGMPVQISAVQEGARSTAATITELHPLLEAKTHMVSAIVVLPTKNGLMSGMHIQANIELGQRLAWSVPRQAVLSDQQGAFIFQVANHKARRVNVKKILGTDSQMGAQLGVEGPLDANLPLVISGNYELQDSMAVRENRP